MIEMRIDSNEDINIMKARHSAKSVSLCSDTYTFPLYYNKIYDGNTYVVAKIGYDILL